MQLFGLNTLWVRGASLPRWLSATKVHFINAAVMCSSNKQPLSVARASGVRNKAAVDCYIVNTFLPFETIKLIYISQAR